jgi:hypothetical protein
MHLKTHIKYIIFSLCLLFVLYAVYLYFHDKSLPNYQTKYDVGTETINGTECAVHYAYYQHHTYKSLCSDDNYPLGEEIGKADKQMVYAIKGHTDMIAIQGIFMSVPIYFKEIK